jgi:hypothetical protein
LAIENRLFRRTRPIRDIMVGMWLGLFLLLLAASPAPPRTCKGRPELVGICFVIHGRLRAYNGNPTFRIWPIGTARLLGVTGPRPGEEPVMPTGLGCDFDHDVYADFEVCPFTAPKEGVMQRTCIESAHRVLAVRKEP